MGQETRVVAGTGHPNRAPQAAALVEHGSVPSVSDAVSTRPKPVLDVVGAVRHPRRTQEAPVE